jgi:hypothetical protein
MRTSNFSQRIAAALSVAACLISSAEAAQVTFNNFSNLSAWQLNGHTAGINPGGLLGGVNNGIDGQVLRLTNNYSQAGSAFLTNSISLANQASFSAAFSFRFTNPLSGGADGIVFTVQTNSNTAGGSGGGIGYAGIGHSVGVEFDNWFNGGTDPNDNHVGINLNGNVASNPVVTWPTPFDNGGLWHAWVDYDGSTDLLEVRFGATNTRPTAALLSTTVDLQNVLGTPNAYVGFTSGTGAAAANHDIVSFSFNDDFAPIGVPEGGSTAIILLIALFPMWASRRKTSCV